MTPCVYSVEVRSAAPAFNQETGKGTVNANAYIARILCHMLVERIPDQGIPELCDSVKNIYAFYHERSKPSVPQVTYQDAIRARLGQVRTRPDFYVEEE